MVRYNNPTDVLTTTEQHTQKRLRVDFVSRVCYHNKTRLEAARELGKREGWPEGRGAFLGTEMVPAGRVHRDGLLATPRVRGATGCHRAPSTGCSW